MKRAAHALVVGGSGMLAGFSRKLQDVSGQVSVLARDEKRIRAVSPGIIPVVCDYNDEAALALALRPLPAPDLLVTWIHGDAMHLRRALASYVPRGGRLIQVLGSANADPSRPGRLAEMAKIAVGLPIDHQAVVLGFIAGQGSSRWLTDDEISNGVFAALKRSDPVWVVGTVKPWSARP